jgi:hypothetical protein
VKARRTEFGRRGCERPTYLYVIGLADGSGPVKIGISRTLNARLDALQTASHSLLKIHHAFSFPDKASAFRAEQAFHAGHGDEYGMHGEWFGMSHQKAAELIELMFFDTPEAPGQP